MEITPPRKIKRIEYIDAMRGFTMLLVVYHHVCHQMVKNNTLLFEQIHNWTFDSLFVIFRMPLFFFVSGFVLYKASRKWTCSDIIEFFKKKLPIQLAFPFVCMLVCLAITNIATVPHAILDPMKAGYWFTFVLLEYYVFYIAIQLLPIKGKLADAVEIAVGIFAYMAIYYGFVYHHWITDMLSISEWKFFAFFIFGVQAHKHFSAFEKLLDKNITITLLLVIFIGLNLMGHCYHIQSFTSVILVFAFFRRYQQSFTQERKLGRVMQYIGRRTLDIYLLHYFFVFTNDWTKYRHFFDNLPLLELICDMAVAVVIISLCLVISNILRLSPFIAHYCFGQKTPVKS